MKTKYMVWGIVPGTDFYSKLHLADTRTSAENWRLRNKKYYKDMRIYWWTDDVKSRFDPNLSYLA